MRTAVVLITNELDVSADWVVRELRRREVPYLRLNTENLTNYRFACVPRDGCWTFATGEDSYELGDLSGIWYRRPQKPSDSVIASLSEPEQDLVARQWQAVIQGLTSIHPQRWINLPHLNEAAEAKMLQLAMARKHGMATPSTLITNDRNDALKFLQVHPSGVVIKGLRAPVIEDENSASFVYTQVIDTSTIETSMEVESSPFILQEQLHPKVDIRVTVVDATVFAVYAHCPATTVDWRVADPPPTFEPFTLPTEISNQCISYLNELGLRFGAFDFAFTTNNEYIFLELNPNGEWGWLQAKSGIPIASAIVDSLTKS